VAELIAHRREAYQVTLEVAGPLAMFARPDTGGTPTSYPVPTWSAVKGIFESIAFLASGSAWMCPTSVAICRPVGTTGGRIRFQQYTNNYGGPLRKASLFAKGTPPGGSSMQLFATVLSDVCYRLHAAVVGPPSAGRIDARHHLSDLFHRRLKQGRCFRTPFLGWSEFTCSYWGLFRKGVTEVDEAVEVEVPSMLLGVWDDPMRGRYAPIFRQDVKVVRGLMDFDFPAAWRGQPAPARVIDAQ
jgi:CRISPR-associated protein Cas5d